MDQRHTPGQPGQRQGIADGGVAAAHDRHFPPAVEHPVAGGAVGHAAAGVLGLTLEAQLARAGAGGDEDAEGLEVAA